MSKVQIVTDSAALFEDPELVRRLGIVVIPLTIRVGEQTYREGVDITAEEFYRKIFSGSDAGRAAYRAPQLAEADTESMPRIVAPRTEDFAALYANLGRTTDKIVSIHNSRRLTLTFDRALQAADTLLGRCDIVPIDSMTTSFGLGVLVEAAARAADAGRSQDDIVRLVRGMIPRVYSVFFAETLDFLERGGRIRKAQALLGTMLGIKLFLTIEDGELIPMEKVRTRERGIEKLVEFVAEFTRIERMAILQSGPEPTEQTHMLLERLAMEFPGRNFPVLVYGPSLGSILGPHSLGIIVYEGAE